MKSTLCWKCIKAYGGCKWSDELKPVKDWKAKKTDLGYVVLECPEFKADLRFYKYKKLTFKELTYMLGISMYVFYNLKLNTVLDLIKVKNLPVILNNGEWYKKNIMEVKNVQT